LSSGAILEHLKKKKKYLNSKVSFKQTDKNKYEKKV